MDSPNNNNLDAPPPRSVRRPNRGRPGHPAPMPRRIRLYRETVAREAREQSLPNPFPHSTADARPTDWTPFSNLRPASRIPSVRPRLQATREALEAHRRLLAEHDARSSEVGSALTMTRMQLDDLSRRLTEATERGQALLTEPDPPILSAGELHPPKRRRLDSTPNEEDERPNIHQVNYGYEGQVVSGKLNMALEYCDGGVFEEGVCCPVHNVPNAEQFGVDNIFDEDPTMVYCTKGSRANIIIKHEGGRPFTMKELIIKAPRSGYTSPVKEGMIFVGMDVDELMMKTAKYKIQYDEEKRKKRCQSIASTQYFPDGSSRTVQSDSVIFARGDSDSAAIIPEQFIGKDEGYRVETICTTDVESDDEAMPWGRAHRPFHAADMRMRQLGRAGTVAGADRIRLARALAQRRRERALAGLDAEESDGDAYVADDLDALFEREMAEDDDDDDDDEDNSDEDDSSTDENSDGDASMADTACPHDDIEESIGAANDAAEASKDGEPKMLKAQAKFSISRGKSTCTMVFEPAISARFILLKLYCPDGGNKRPASRKGNIDIQNVMVKGWCGPRVFQSVQLI